MLPQNTLSTEPVPAVFEGGRALTVSNILDYELGGVGINDPSQGLQVQTWRARIIDDTEIVLDSGTVTPFTLITGINITEVSFSFDRNMNPAVAYVEDGVPKLYWYDSVLAGMTTTEYPNIITPRLTHDDKRELQSIISDVIFAYIRDGALYYRQQRDRYSVEIDPTEELDEPEKTDYRALIASSPGLIKIGMGNGLRLQFMLHNPV